MLTLTRELKLILYIGVLCLLALVFLRPGNAHAQVNLGAATDKMCTLKCTQAQAQNPPKPCPTATVIPCTSLTVVGVCQIAGCKAVTAGGTGVDTGLQMLGQVLGQLMGKLMQQPPAAPAPAATTGTTGTTATTPATCTISSSISSSDASSTTATISWSPVNATSASISPDLGIGTISPNGGSQQVVVTTSTSYMMTVGGAGGSGYCSTTVLGPGSTAGGTNGSCSLLDQISGNCGSSTTATCPTVSTSVICSSGYVQGPAATDANGCQVAPSCVLDTSNSNNSNTTTATCPTVSTSVICSSGYVQGPAATDANGCQVAPQCVLSNPSTVTPAVLNPFNQATLIPVGAHGDIQILGNGATIIAGTRDQSGNTETSGFYGTNTFGGQQPQDLVAQLCQNRPWAGGFLSTLISPSFFDGLCTWRGYQVGTPVVVQPQVTVVQSAAQPAVQQATVVATSTPTVTPKVQIWAVPASVSLGARTTIFWNSQGVTSCTEKSPDGSFNQSTLSGGASTVALTGATVFAISCLAPDGSPVTDYVTVNLSI